MVGKRRQPDAVGTKRCGIYIRVSTEMQVDRNSLSTQKTQLLSYVESHGWTVAKLFTDAGLSAKDTRRPAFQEMMKWAQDGKLDVILVSKLDRISRNMMDLLNLIDDLKDWGVDFVSSSQSFDTSTPMGTLILNMLGSFAQFEREMTGERVRENMRERAKKGVWSGGQTPFGYRLNPETKLLEIEPVEAETVRTIFDTYLQSRSVRNTVHTINAEKVFNRDGKPWGLTSMRRLLGNPIYVGTICYAKRKMRGSHLIKQDAEDWIVVGKACEPIMEKDRFEEVQDILRGNGHERSWKEASPHLLSGLVRCGVCGGKMYGATVPRKTKNGLLLHRYYRCAAQLQKGRAVCEGMSYRAAELEDAVVGELLGFDVDTLREELQTLKDGAAKLAAPLARRRKRLEAEYEAFREREMRLLELYEEAAIDMVGFKQRRKELDSQKLDLARQIADLESRTPEGGTDDIDPDALARKYHDLQDTFPHLPVLGRRQMLQAMIRDVVAHPDGRVEIDFNVIAGLEPKAIPLQKSIEVSFREDRTTQTLTGKGRAKSA